MTRSVSYAPPYRRAEMSFAVAKVNETKWSWPIPCELLVCSLPGVSWQRLLDDLETMTKKMSQKKETEIVFSLVQFCALSVDCDFVSVMENDDGHADLKSASS